VPNTFFHTTPAAEEILRAGFRDAEGSYGLTTLTLRGVFVANIPVDCNEGAIGDQVLEILLPGDVDLTNFELIDEGRHSAYREWCVPAELLNARAEARLLTEAEVEARLRQWAVPPKETDRTLSVSGLSTTVDQEKAVPGTARPPRGTDRLTTPSNPPKSASRPGSR
jgi:hypothetical protein